MSFFYDLLNVLNKIRRLSSGATSFFEEFLRSQDMRLTPEDRRFDKEDRDAFVFALLQLRLSGKIIFPPASYDIVAPMLFPQAQKWALQFVSRFLCYFVPKPPKYQEQIANFKSSFIPNFASNEDLQARLVRAVTPAFSTVSLEEAPWEDLSYYFIPERERAAEMAFS